MIGALVHYFKEEGGLSLHISYFLISDCHIDKKRKKEREIENNKERLKNSES